METYLDVDGCLLDENYTQTTQLVLPERALVTLNSNRSLESLQEVQKRFGISGPIIFENGSASFNGTIESFAPALKRSTLEQILGKIRWIDTDSLRRWEPIDGYVLFGERTRRFTSTLYPRADNTRAYTQEMLESLSERLRMLNGYRTSIDPLFGNISILPVGIDKSTPIQEGQAAFGDTRHDVPMFALARIVGCPQNAEADVREEIRRRGGLVCAPYTAGVNEFLAEVYR